MPVPPRYLIPSGGDEFRNQSQDARGSYFHGKVIVFLGQCSRKDSKHDSVCSVFDVLSIVGGDLKVGVTHVSCVAFL